MSFTPEQRAKSAATRAANKAARDAKKEAKAAKPKAAVEPTSREAELLAELASYKAKLGMVEEQLTEQQATNLALASAEVGGEHTDRPTGKTKMVTVFDRNEVKGYKDDGTEILRPKFKKAEVPTYYYRINMAPCGGAFLMLNGCQYFHGTTYEFDAATLSTVKEICYRTWDHHRNTNKNDENFYRKDQEWIKRNGTALGRGVF